MAVVRISGSRSLEALKKMTSISKLEPRKAILRKIRDPETREVIDNGLCLWFPGGHDFRAVTFSFRTLNTWGKFIQINFKKSKF